MHGLIECSPVAVSLYVYAKGTGSLLVWVFVYQPVCKIADSPWRYGRIVCSTTIQQALSQLQSLIYVWTNDPHWYSNMLQGKRKPHSKYQEPAVWTAVLSWGAPVPVDSVLLLYVYFDHSNGLLANGWCISIKFTRKSSVACINYRWNLHQKSIPTGHLLLTTVSRYKGRIWNSFEDYLVNYWFAVF